jgi:hypothetical protein
VQHIRDRRKLANLPGLAETQRLTTRFELRRGFIETVGVILVAAGVVFTYAQLSSPSSVPPPILTLSPR